MKRIDEDGEKLYKDLIEWNNIYGSGIENDIVDAWEKAKGAMSDNIPVLEQMRNIMTEIATISKEIASIQANGANVASDKIGIRDFFENMGNVVDWNDDTKQFSINGQWFDSDNYENIGGRLYATLEQLEHLLYAFEHGLGKLPGFASGGYIKTDQVAVVHAGERVLRSVETTDLHTILPQLSSGIALNNNLFKQLSEKYNRGMMVEPNVNSGININIDSPVHFDGIATKELASEFEVKLAMNNQNLISRINNDLKKLGTGRSLKPF